MSHITPVGQDLVQKKTSFNFCDDNIIIGNKPYNPIGLNPLGLGPQQVFKQDYKQHSTPFVFSIMPKPTIYDKYADAHFKKQAEVQNMEQYAERLEASFNGYNLDLSNLIRSNEKAPPSPDRYQAVYQPTILSPEERIGSTSFEKRKEDIKNKMVLNPLTNRKIKVGSKRHQHLVEDGVLSPSSPQSPGSPA